MTSCVMIIYMQRHPGRCQEYRGKKQKYQPWNRDWCIRRGPGECIQKPEVVCNPYCKSKSAVSSHSSTSETHNGIWLPSSNLPLTIGSIWKAGTRWISIPPGGRVNSKFSMSSIRKECISRTLLNDRTSETKY